MLATVATHGFSNSGEVREGKGVAALLCFVFAALFTFLLQRISRIVFLVFKLVHFPFFWKNFKGEGWQPQQPSPHQAASLWDVSTVMFAAFSLFTMMLSGIN